MIDIRGLRIALFCGLLSSCVNGPSGSIQRINGAEDPSLDVPAVQDAVDRGGTVSLEGDFDFGDQSIEVTSSVLVQGNRGTSGEYLTKIMNGYNSFLIQEGESGPDIQVAIEDLSFDGATGSAIVIHTGHVTIKGNRMRNIGYRPSEIKDRVVAAGIDIGDHQKPGSISEAVIEDNDIEINTEYDSSKHLSYGILVDGISPSSRLKKKKITIKGNVIQDFGETAVLIFGNEGASLLISENQIDSSPRKAFYGIAGHGTPDLELGPMIIIDNLIILDGFLAIGFPDLCESRIANNLIKISERDYERNAGIRLTGSRGGSGSKNNSIEENRIEGTSRYGLAIEGSAEAPSEGNVIRDNDFSGHNSTTVTIKLGEHTRNNTVQLSSSDDTVMDCGQDNQIQGAQPVECLSTSE